MMPVQCPSCKTVHSLPESALGKNARCKKCQHVFLVAHDAGLVQLGAEAAGGGLVPVDSEPVTTAVGATTLQLVNDGRATPRGRLRSKVRLLVSVGVGACVLLVAAIAIALVFGPKWAKSGVGPSEKSQDRDAGGEASAAALAEIIADYQTHLRRVYASGGTEIQRTEAVAAAEEEFKARIVRFGPVTFTGKVLEIIPEGQIYAGDFQFKTRNRWGVTMSLPVEFESVVRSGACTFGSKVWVDLPKEDALSVQKGDAMSVRGTVAYAEGSALTPTGCIDIQVWPNSGTSVVKGSGLGDLGHPHMIVLRVSDGVDCSVGRFRSLRAHNFMEPDAPPAARTPTPPPSRAEAPAQGAVPPVTRGLAELLPGVPRPETLHLTFTDLDDALKYVQSSKTAERRAAVGYLESAPVNPAAHDKVFAAARDLLGDATYGTSGMNILKNWATKADAAALRGLLAGMVRTSAGRRPSGAADQATGIIELLVKFEDKASAATLADCLRDAALRQSASEALVSFGADSETVMQPLAMDKDRATAGEALKILGKIGTEKSLLAIHRTLCSDDSEIAALGGDCFKRLAERLKLKPEQYLYTLLNHFKVEPPEGFALDPAFQQPNSRQWMRSVSGRAVKSYFAVVVKVVPANFRINALRGGNTVVVGPLTFQQVERVNLQFQQGGRFQALDAEYLIEVAAVRDTTDATAMTSMDNAVKAIQVKKEP